MIGFFLFDRYVGISVAVGPRISTLHSIIALVAVEVSLLRKKKHKK
jgi:hypothetical protein